MDKRDTQPSIQKGRKPKMAGLQEAVAQIDKAADPNEPEGAVTMLREAQIRPESAKLTQAPTSRPRSSIHDSTPPARMDSGLFESAIPTRVYRIEGYGPTRWGMSANEVQDVCPGAQAVTPERLEERKRVAKLPAEVTYLLADDRLYAASITFRSSLDTGMEYIAKFKNLRRLLSKKYGEPIDSKTTFNAWRSCNSGFVLEHSSYHGVLVESGRMQMSCSWEVAETKVWMYLGCKKTRQPTITIEYESTHLKEESVQLEEEQLLEDL